MISKGTGEFLRQASTYLRGVTGVNKSAKCCKCEAMLAKRRHDLVSREVSTTCGGKRLC